MRYLLVAVFLAGCADIRIPLAHTDAHLQQLRRDVRTCGSLSQMEREQVDHNLDWAMTWTAAAIEHKGMPPQPILIAETPRATGREVNEKALLKKYNTEVQQEKALRAMASGWLMKTVGGVGGGGGIAAIIALFMKKLKQRDRTIAEYDATVEEGVPKTKRVALGKKRPAMSAAHEKLASG